MSRLLGRQPAVHDPRVPLLSRRMSLAKVPKTPDQVAWHAMLPADGVPMLGNDLYGCCVEATPMHYLQMVNLYKGILLRPTTGECLQAYSDITGFRQDDPATDNGSLVMGTGGLIQYWSTHGLLVGGKLNRCGPVATVNFKNADELQLAIYLFGAVLMGANLTHSDVQSVFMFDGWDANSVAGGHEFAVTGYVRTEHAVRYDILTWNGMWRASDTWVTAAAQEALVVYDEDFFDARNVSPSGIDRVALSDDLKLFSVV